MKTLYGILLDSNFPPLDFPVFLSSLIVLLSLFDFLIAVDNNFSISPKGAVDNLPKAAQVVIRQIQTVCRRNLNCGILVVSRSWSRGTQGKAIDGVICDVLVVSENMGGLHLYTLCDTETYFITQMNGSGKMFRTLRLGTTSSEKK